MLSQSDRIRVIKLLNLTTSANDHEALSAIRKANAVLAEHKILWGEFVRPYDSRETQEPQRSPEPRTNRVENFLVEMLIKTVKFRSLTTLERLVFESISAEYIKSGSISLEQLGQLRRLAGVRQ